MAVIKPRFTTRFLASARVYTPPASEHMEATASLDKLRALLPPGIDPETYPTLLYIAANLAVGGVVNLNGDAVTLEDTLRTYRGFESQFVDVEHDRSELRGFIVKAGLSELGTDRLITEDEARATGNPVNVAVVIALWKVVDSDLCDYIQQMDAPGSPDRGKLSLSFEVGFDDYDVVVLPNGATNLSLATQIVTPDSPDFGKYDKLLRVNGGKGAFGKDAHVARILMGNIVPLGAGIVTVPAAAVKGLTTIATNPHVDEAAAAAVPPIETEAGAYKYSSTQCTLAPEDAEPFLAFARSIPDEHVYTDEKDATLGRETEPHITCLYGIVGADHAPIQACLANFGPISATMGELSVFEGNGRPYDVLKVDVHSEDLHRLHHLIKTTTATETKWPEYHPHLTIAYVKAGMGRGYAGDTRFKGRGLTFPSISFSPHTGDRVEIPLKMVDGAETVTQTPASAPHLDQFGQVHSELSAPQSGDSEVYSDDEAMATPSRQIKLSQGWQERIAAFIAAEQAAPGWEAKAGAAPLVNGVNITLSDGRTFSNVRVFDGQTLELDKELSMSGVVITDMTPGARPQADDKANENPAKGINYPTTSADQQARDAANLAADKAGQNAAYTDASTKTAATNNAVKAVIASMTRAGGFLSANVTSAGVSSSNPTSSPMNLAELKQSLASVKTVEDLPTAVANVSAFADAIAAASEKMVAERAAAQDAAKAAQASVEQIKADLAKLTATHNEMVASQQAAAAQIKFDEHMAAVASTFDLDDEVRAEIIEEVKAASTDEAFAKWLASAKKKMKGFVKKKADDKKADDDGDDDDAKAAKAAKLALASAANNPTDPAHRHDFAATASLADKMKETFANNISVGGVKVSELNKQAKK